MSLSATQRRQVMFTQEGWALARVNDHGVDEAADICRSQVDGNFNALVRLEGQESAARFAFALGDRVAGGLKEPTDYRALVVRPAVAIEHAPKAEQHAWQWRSWWWGFFCGAVCLAFMTYGRFH